MLTAAPDVAHTMFGINYSKPIALGMFVGDRVYSNTLNPKIRFMGREDDVSGGVDANPLLAAVHVLTFLHMPTNPKKVPNTAVMTLRELIELAGLECEQSIEPCATSTQLPPPLQLLVSDMRATTTNTEMAVVAGITVALRRTLDNISSFMWETKQRAEFVKSLVEHLHPPPTLLITANEVKVPDSHRTSTVLALPSTRAARWQSDTQNLLKKVNMRVANFVHRPHDAILRAWHEEIEMTKTVVCRKRRSGASRPVSSNKKSKKSSSSNTSNNKRRQRRRRRPTSDPETETDDDDDDDYQQHFS